MIYLKCYFNILLIIFVQMVSIQFGNASGRIINNKYTEYDVMHPQLPFRQQLHSSEYNDGNRIKRAKMPTLKFNAPTMEQNKDYWSEKAQSILKHQLEKNRLNKNIAKNIIMFLGDGMSIPTLTATRVYMGGEEQHLSFERFPYSGLSKTYCTNTQVADSACTATAYLCGIKANYATIGLTASVLLGDCMGENNTVNHVDSIAKWAQNAGWSTGLITTTQVTHASPAGVYAHTANRNWENNEALLNDNGNPEYCTDIAKQLIYGDVGGKLKVIMGGGRQEFLRTTDSDVDGVFGKRTDGINLIQQWQNKHNHMKTNAKYIQTRDELLNITAKETDYILGLFDASHIPFNIDADHNTKPTLAEMVEKALDIMEKDKKGYFLFVEGGRIDHGHHNAQAIRALDETVEFSKAVELAINRTNQEDTLIVVTSDHSHTMSIAGYSSRGNDILGINDSQFGVDNLPYSTLNYANGPGYEFNKFLYGRKNLINIDMHESSYAFPSVVPLEQETHGGDDVAVFAIGPWSHLFTGVYEQNFIPHAMAYAACIGNGSTACNNTVMID